MYQNYEKTIKRLGLTTYKVSKETGVSQSLISFWKKDISIPKRDKMQKIADYLGVSVDYLYGNEDEPKNKEILYKFSLEEATAVFIESVASENDIHSMTNNDKKEFQRYLLEQAELAYLKFQKNKGSNKNDSNR